MKINIAFPGESLSEAYFETRYLILRKPLRAPKGSERIDGDDEAIHVWIEDKGLITSIGRVAVIPLGNDGSVIDKEADSSCPAFQPLSCDYKELEDDNGLVIPKDLRPAMQIRQMGTLENHRGKGLASMVLKELEQSCQKQWDVKSGWLQSRIEALPFYKANGWTAFGNEYLVNNVGLHRSMWKKF